MFTFLVSLPMWILVGCGVADLFLAGLGDPDALLALPAGLPLSLDPERDLLLGGGEGDALFLGASTPPSPLVGSTGRLAGGEDPGSLSTSGFLGPGFPFDSLFDFLLFLFLSSLSLLLLESELESLLESLELSLLELELELLAFLRYKSRCRKHNNTNKKKPFLLSSIVPSFFLASSLSFLPLILTAV